MLLGRPRKLGQTHYITRTTKDHEELFTMQKLNLLGRHLELDLCNSFSRVETLGTCTSAVEDRVTPV